MKKGFIKTICVISCLLMFTISANAASITLQPPEGAGSYVPQGAKNTIVYTVKGDDITLTGTCEGGDAYLFVNKNYVIDAVIDNPDLLKEGIPLEQKEGRFSIHIDKGLLVNGSYPNRVFVAVSDGKAVSGSPVMLIYTGAEVESDLDKSVSEMVKDKDAIASRARLAGYIFDILKLKPVTDLNLFKDMDKVPYDLRQKVAAVAQAGLMLGGDGYFNPNGAVTQQMLSVIIERAKGYKAYIAEEPNAQLTEEQTVRLLLETMGGDST